MNTPVRRCDNCGAAAETASDKHCRSCGTRLHDAPDAPAAVERSSAHRVAEQRTAGQGFKLLQYVLGLTLLLALFGLVTADRMWLHVYYPDVNRLNARLDQQAAALQTAQNRIDYVETARDKSSTASVTSAIDDALIHARMTTAIAILSLATNYGGQQSSASSAGKACVNYLLLGTGSVTDCGFRHVDQ